MSALVGAVKSYAYMDRGELVEVDVHEGLETTLTVLGHKLKHTEIEVVRDYDRTLPQAHRARLRAQPGLDEPARQRDRRARRARHDHDHAPARDGDCARVDIADDGPGIPAGRPRRTSSTRSSPPRTSASGTGLGLDTARRIVVERHDGSLTLETEPGPHDVPRAAALHADLTARSTMTSCTHLDHVQITELPEAVDGCEDCLRDAAIRGCTCASAWSAATSAAATTRPTGTRARTRAPAAIR